MSIKFRKSDTTYTLLNMTSRVTTPSLCHRKNGTTYYTPLLTSRSQTISDYVYSASNPTVCVRKNNTTYYAAKSRTEVYDIPAGTYLVTNFRSYIWAFVDSDGGQRTCTNQFTITAIHNNSVSSQSTIPANSVIKCYSQYSGEREGVSFNGGVMNSESWATGKAGVILKDTYNGEPFKDWANVYITISPGIKFN